MYFNIVIYFIILSRNYKNAFNLVVKELIYAMINPHPNDTICSMRLGKKHTYGAIGS